MTASGNRSIVRVWKVENRNFPLIILFIQKGEELLNNRSE